MPHPFWNIDGLTAQKFLLFSLSSSSSMQSEIPTTKAIAYLLVTCTSKQRDLSPAYISKLACALWFVLWSAFWFALPLLLVIPGLNLHFDPSARKALEGVNTNVPNSSSKRIKACLVYISLFFTFLSHCHTYSDYTACLQQLFWINTTNPSTSSSFGVLTLKQLFPQASERW